MSIRPRGPCVRFTCKTHLFMLSAQRSEWRRGCRRRLREAFANCFASAPIAGSLHIPAGWATRSSPERPGFEWRATRPAGQSRQGWHAQGGPGGWLCGVQASPRPKGRFDLQGLLVLWPRHRRASRSVAHVWPGVGQGANREENARENASRRQRKVWIPPPLASTHSKLFPCSAAVFASSAHRGLLALFAECRI